MAKKVAKKVTKSVLKRILTADRHTFSLPLIIQSLRSQT